MLSMPTNFNDPGYFAKLTIWHNQQTQDQQNQKAHDDYVTAYNNWMVQNGSKRDHGQPIDPALNPPKMVTYNDDGSTTLSDFPDLKVTELPTQVQSGGPVSPPAMDRTDAILMIVSQILNILQKGQK